MVQTKWGFWFGHVTGIFRIFENPILPQDTLSTELTGIFRIFENPILPRGAGVAGRER